ncbi:hypothetical protein FFLO_01122 [Filobasidium floriforme]|uniref:Uncharacterized protein n=1 Tax=Filobasidium floriforme TaxID=5210 RepID=A0A8K0NV52_9TREE|nr:uncharacterized protein HD553DRAFT_340010 [Filobasidium floriforme]KAG7570924.1 hypothetical protein FFLO_01122 [Filobasidium floriforme]KAH8087903.1 hypothetical protein HD553DRAFT_340010 [Filobasidium floriforme]
MCKAIECPNHAQDTKYTWWGCGGHIEQALAPYEKEQICDCEHEPIPGNPNVFQPKQK